MNATRRPLLKPENPDRKRLLNALALIIVVTCPLHAHAAELGRLFYTPQQRAELETQAAIGSAEPDASPNYLMLNGVIQKQGGNRIVWINGKAQTPTHGVRDPASLEVAVPGKPRHVEVKVGQKLILRAAAPASAVAAPPAPRPKAENDEE